MGNYRYSRKIGQGGMAQVFLAIQEGIGGFEKPVVVKRIFPHLCQGDHFVKMFLDEARLAATVRHPNVVEIFDIGQDDEGYYIIMEYLSGETVAMVAQTLSRQKRAVPPHIACRIGASVAAGLHHAHQAVDTRGNPQPVVHRDVTPSNLILCFNGAVKIVDFGIAKAIESAEEGSDASNVKGKLSYLSPEQVRHQPVDARTDVFQLGIVMHEMLCGRRLFNARTNHQKILAVLDREIPRPSSVNPKIPGFLDDIVLDALERDRDQRTASAEDFRQQLEDALKRMGESVSPAELGGWLESTIPTAYANRLQLERQAIKAARTSPKIIDSSPPQKTSEPSAVVPTPEADTMAARSSSFEDEGPTPAANGQRVARPKRAESLISALLANAKADAGSPDYDPAMEQPTMEVADRALGDAVAESQTIALEETQPKKKSWWLAALAALLIAGVAGMLLANSGGERSATSAKAAYADPAPGERSGTGDRKASEDPVDTAKPATPDPSATDATYRVSVIAVPASAELEFDGGEKLVGSFKRTLPRDRSNHVLVVSAPGYQTRAVSFSADQPPPAVVELKREASSRSGKASKRKRPGKNKRKTPAANKDEAKKPADAADADKAKDKAKDKTESDGPLTDNLDPWAD